MSEEKKLLQYCSSSLLESAASDPEFWLSTAPISIITLAILKSSFHTNQAKALESVVKTITNPDWKIKDDKDKEVAGIEHPGLHMILKKIAQHDKTVDGVTFGKTLLDRITDDTIKLWLTLNRGCFLLVAVYENGSEEVQQQMKQTLSSHKSYLKNNLAQGHKYYSTS